MIMIRPKGKPLKIAEEAIPNFKAPKDDMPERSQHTQVLSEAEAKRTATNLNQGRLR